jgi:hypothetical protein
MKTRFILVLLLCSVMGYSQQLNVKNFGAKGDGVSNDSPAFKKAISEIKKNNVKNKKYFVLFIPSGEYILSEPILLDSYVSLEGELANATIIRILSTASEGIIMEDNRNEKDIYNGYTSIKNLSILGPDFNKNPFEWKNGKLNNPRSVGIKILGLRNRIENCVIDGFLWSGIETSASYYNFITKNFIRNNRIGITINNTSTSCYINNNEIRTNAIGIVIQNQSFANFINNNMLESNIANFLEADTSENGTTSMTKGKGVLLLNTSNNFIQNNYFEQHYINLALQNANSNEISSNFIAIGDLMPAYASNQAVLKLYGVVKNNRIAGNQTLETKPTINPNKMIIPIGDFSSNWIDFGKEKNDQIKTELSKKEKNTKNWPQIP